MSIKVRPMSFGSWVLLCEKCAADLFSLITVYEMLHVFFL